jgi:nitroreductase
LITQAADLRHDTLEAMRQTRHTREFTTEPLSGAQVDTILEAARWSGSAVNRQAWMFVAVRDREVLARLSELAPDAAGVPSSAVTIAIGMHPGDDPEWDPFDEGRAGERMLIAATALGLAASVAWVAPSANRRKVAQLLELPEPYYVRTLVSVGYPTARARERKSPRGKARKPFAEVTREMGPH